MKYRQEWRRREAILLTELGVRRHIGHLPLQMDVVEGWTFRRCPCGFDLAMSPERTEWWRGGPLVTGGVVYWLRKNHAAVVLDSLTSLLRALNSHCRCHLRYPLFRSAARWKPEPHLIVGDYVVDQAAVASAEIVDDAIDLSKGARAFEKVRQNIEDVNRAAKNAAAGLREIPS